MVKTKVKKVKLTRRKLIDFIMNKAFPVSLMWGNLMALAIFIMLCSDNSLSESLTQSAYIMGLVSSSLGFGLVFILGLIFTIKDSFKSWKNRSNLKKCQFKHCQSLTNKRYSGTYLCNRHWGKMQRALEREEQKELDTNEIQTQS